MDIILKCSFKNSNGFKISKYDVSSGELEFLPENAGGTGSQIPRTIMYTLNYQLGHCIILATDENGHLFLGIYRLVEGNDEKYVNAIFYAPDEQYKIIDLYNLFCSQQASFSNKLLSSVVRVDNISDESKLQYTVDHEIIDEMFVNVGNAKKNGIMKIPNNQLLAFFSVEEFDSYKSVLDDKFQYGKNFIYRQFDPSKEVMDKHNIVPNNSKPNMVFIIVIIILIIILVFLV